MHAGSILIFLDVMNYPPTKQSAENADIYKNLKKIIFSGSHPEKMQQSQTSDKVDRFVQALPALGSHCFDCPIE